MRSVGLRPGVEIIEIKYCTTSRSLCTFMRFLCLIDLITIIALWLDTYKYFTDSLFIRIFKLSLILSV